MLPILARILKDRGIVTERQLQEAIHHQVLYGGRLGTSLYELGMITEERLQEALARCHGIVAPPLSLRDLPEEPEKLIPRALAAKHKVFPYKVRGKTIFLLMVDPDDHGAVAKVGFSLGYIVKPLVVPEFRMIQLLRDHYGVDERWRYDDTFRPPALAPLTAMSPEAAEERIDQASTRDEVVAGVLALCHGTFRRVVFFIVREPWVLGWSGMGEGMDREAALALRVPLDEPSVFQAVTRDRAVFVGRFGPEAQNQAFLAAVGKRPNTNAALFPVVLKGRVVNLIYGDSGAGGNVKADLGDLMVALQKVPRAYLRIIRKRVADTRKATGAEPGDEERDIE